MANKTNLHDGLDEHDRAFLEWIRNNPGKIPPKIALKKRSVWNKLVLAILVLEFGVSLNTYLELKRKPSEYYEEPSCSLTQDTAGWLSRTHSMNSLTSDVVLERFRKSKKIGLSNQEIRDAIAHVTECVVFQSDGKKSLESEQIDILNRMFRVFGMYPKKIFPRSLSLVGMQDLSKNKIWGDAQPASGFIRLDPRSDQETGHHEVVHILFKHDDRDHKWRNDIGNYDASNPINFVNIRTIDSKYPRYGMTDSYEDEATVGEKLFSVQGWRLLRSQMKKSEVMKKKVTQALKNYSDKSGGWMDEEYFRRIETGEITDAVSAQAYFREKERLEKEEIEKNFKIRELSVMLEYPQSRLAEAIFGEIESREILRNRIERLSRK